MAESKVGHVDDVGLEGERGFPGVRRRHEGLASLAKRVVISPRPWRWIRMTCNWPAKGRAGASAEQVNRLTQPAAIPNTLADPSIAM